MPLIAKSPQYTANRRVPGTIGVPYADLRPSSAENRAIGRIGEVLGARAEQMNQERDAAVVGDIYNRWRDEDREVKTALFNKTGMDAVNLGRDYDKFFTKSLSEATEQAENGTQQKSINKMLASIREDSLDQLARHEGSERKLHTQQQQNGVFANGVTDVVAAGFDIPKVMQNIGRVNTYFRATNPGMAPEQLEALLKSNTSKMLYASMKQQIALGQNDSALMGQAAENLENWKEPLGIEYSKLKSQLKSGVKLAQLDNAYNALIAGYGQNFEGAISEINNPKSAIMKGMNFEQRNQLNTRFKGLYNQRESQEAEREEERKEVVADNDFEAWTRHYQNELTPGQLDEWANNRLISESTYRGIKNIKKGGVKNNNPYVVGPLAERLALGEDIRDDLNAAAASGDIKDETFISMSKTNASSQKKEGMGFLVRSLKPTQADKYDPDLHLRYADAIDLYNIRVRELPEGMTPTDVARDIVDSYTSEIRRTMGGLKEPRYFEGREYTLDTLSEAQKRTIEAYYDKEILEGEYSFEIRLIQQYLDYIKKTGEITPAIKKQIESRRK